MAPVLTQFLQVQNDPSLDAKQHLYQIEKILIKLYSNEIKNVLNLHEIICRTLVFVEDF